MTIRVKLFAIAKQLAETGEIAVELPSGATVADLRREVVAQFPALTPCVGYVLIALDREYAADETMIRPDQEAALIPPVSGG